jgi:hypothetical protein
MPESKEPISININDGEPFFSHEMTINFTPTQFTLDFKCITPRTDPRSKKPSFLLKHNVVMVEPWHAKAILNVLANVIKKYEDEYGPIKKPKAIEVAEKKQKKAMKAQQSQTETPSYLG